MDMQVLSHTVQSHGPRVSGLHGTRTGGGQRMKCTYCSRQSDYELPGGSIRLCECCAKAFREGFEKGRVYESVARRKQFEGKKR